MLSLLPGYHLAADIQCGPESFGWWSTRKRRFLVLLREGWSLQQDEESFLRIFSRKRPQTGKRGQMFYSAPAAEVRSAKRRRMTGQCKATSMSALSGSSRTIGSQGPLTDAEVDKIKWEAFYTEGQISRLRMYEKAAARELFKGCIDDTNASLSSGIRASLRVCRFQKIIEGTVPHICVKLCHFLSQEIDMGMSCIACKHTDAHKKEGSKILSHLIMPISKFPKSPKSLAQIRSVSCSVGFSCSSESFGIGPQPFRGSK